LIDDNKSNTKRNMIKWT